MSILANFCAQKKHKTLGQLSFLVMSKRIVKTMTIMICISSYAYAAKPEKTTKARRDSFYKHQEEVKKQDAQREKGKEAQRVKRRNEEERYEKNRQQYVQKRKADRNEERERKAEAWILEQQAKEEKKREQAKIVYRSSKEQKLQYKIPENEEFGIQPPPLENKVKSKTAEPRSRLGSGRLRF